MSNKLDGIKNDINKLKLARDGGGPFSRITHYELARKIKEIEGTMAELLIEAKARNFIISKLTLSNLTEKDGQSFHENFCVPRDAFVPVSITKLYQEIEIDEKVEDNE